jgi:hypothetical protein
VISHIIETSPISALCRQIHRRITVIPTADFEIGFFETLEN